MECQYINSDATTNPSKNILPDLGEYEDKQFDSDARKFAESSNIKSGFANLDAVINLDPGLYILGALPSLGKTTFICQMADQLAEQNINVLLFSLEMTKLQIVSKSLSRIISPDSLTCEMTSRQVLRCMDDPRVQEARKIYRTFAQRITVVDAIFELSVDDIERNIQLYIDKHQVVPIVMVDYLQILHAPRGMRGTTREIVDENVAQLRRIQAKYNMMMLVVSSLNRANYFNEIDFDSFKESGGIEHDCDLLFGLQFSAIHNEIFDKNNAVNEKRKIMSEAKTANPREIELVCLKNRSGISGFNLLFDYYPRCNKFVPLMDGIEQYLQDCDSDGFVTIPDGVQTPF